MAGKARASAVAAARRRKLKRERVKTVQPVKRRLRSL
jgi:hypothetical protein